MLQDAVPEVVSVPAKETVSAALYQPFAFGWREAVAVVCGGVASYFSAYARGETFPARSRHAPETDVVTASGPE